MKYYYSNQLFGFDKNQQTTIAENVQSVYKTLVFNT